MVQFQPTKEFYIANRGKTCRVGRSPVVTVSYQRTSGQSGSWERGFKFHDTEWAMLTRKRKGQPTEYSMDHGKTWHPSVRLAKQSKGKLKLTGSSHTELAFESIQRINRDYYGSSYKWRR